MNFLLDTNTVSYYFKGIPAVVGKFLQCKPEQIFLPAVVVYEIEYRIAKSKNSQKKKSQFDALVNDCTVLDFGRREALAAAEIRADLEESGKSIGPYDILIAATALAHQMTSVTHDSAEFRRVSRLRLVDWAA